MQSYYPMEGVRVELMDSDCDGSEICDEKMGTSRVQADGSFTVTGRGGDPGWIGSPIHFGSWALRLEFGHSVRHALDGDGSHFSA